MKAVGMAFKPKSPSSKEIYQGVAVVSSAYLSRAATAKSNKYDNGPEETRYIYTDFNPTGERLVGAKRYTST
jgi:hypothetical protein